MTAKEWLVRAGEHSADSLRSFSIVQLIGYAILAVISPLLGRASLPLLTPAFFATLILLVLARILVELERIRDLMEIKHWSNLE